MDRITKDMVIQKLENVYDIEIGFDIVSLGLIYDVIVDNENNINVKMTLTTPMCPMAGMMVDEATSKVQELKDAKEVKVDLIFDPPWQPSMAKEEVRQVLGL